MLIVGKLVDLTDAKTKQNTFFSLLINAKCLGFFSIFSDIVSFLKNNIVERGIYQWSQILSIVISIFKEYQYLTMY